MISSELDHPWFYWSLVIVLGLPCGAILLSEATSRIENTRFNAYAGSLLFLRNFLLPAFFLTVLLRWVVGFDGSHYSVQVVETVIWILGVNFVLSVSNLFFFADADGEGISNRAPKLLLDLLRFFMVLFATAIVVSAIWGIELGRLLTALGIGSVVIGLALQDTLGSLFAGIAMVSSGQKKVGDWVSVADEEGFVENLNWRAVTIRTVNDDLVVIPNSMIARNKFVVRASGTDHRTLGLDVYFSYDHPPQEVMNMLEQTAMATRGVIEFPPPESEVMSYDDRGVRYWMWITVGDMEEANNIRNDVRCNIWYAARRQGLVFPSQHHLHYQLPRELRTSRPPTAKDLAQSVADLGAIPRTADQILPLMKNARSLRFHKGEVLLEQGAIMRDIFIVLEGVVEARGAREKEEYLDEDEELKPVIFEPGQTIAFKSIFRSKPCLLEVRAQTDALVIAITAAEFKSYLESDTTLATEWEEIIDSIDVSARQQQLIDDDEENQDIDNQNQVKLLRKIFAGTDH